MIDSHRKNQSELGSDKFTNEKTSARKKQQRIDLNRLVTTENHIKEKDHIPVPNEINKTKSTFPLFAQSQKDLNLKNALFPNNQGL